MRIVGGLDIHRRQITFDYRDERSGQIHRGRIAPADRMLLRRWLATTLEGAPAAFAVEGCTGLRFVGGELARAGGGGGGGRSCGGREWRRTWPSRPRPRPRAGRSGGPRPTAPTPACCVSYWRPTGCRGRGAPPGRGWGGGGGRGWF